MSKTIYDVLPKHKWAHKSGVDALQISHIEVLPSGGCRLSFFEEETTVTTTEKWFQDNVDVAVRGFLVMNERATMTYVRETDFLDDYTRIGDMAQLRLAFPVLHFFAWQHLKDMRLQAVSQRFALLAYATAAACDLTGSANSMRETLKALDALLIAKDAAVRACLPL